MSLRVSFDIYNCKNNDNIYLLKNKLDYKIIFSKADETFSIYTNN